MYYELYIDIFLLVNVVINFMVLSMLKRLLKLKGGIVRRVLAAVWGAVLLCVYILTDFRFIPVLYYLFMIIIGINLVLISFKISSAYAFIKSVVIFFIISLCLNGFLNQISRFVDSFWKLIIIVAGGYFLLEIVKYRFEKTEKKQKIICDVELYFENGKLKINGLWDTGNCLISPYHNRGVSVIEYRACEKFLDSSLKNKIKLCMGEKVEKECFENKEEKVFLIPYRTIGNSNGILPVITVKKMTVKKAGETIEFKNALLGIVKNDLSHEGEYKIILSTKI